MISESFLNCAFSMVLRTSACSYMENRIASLVLALFRFRKFLNVLVLFPCCDLFARISHQLGKAPRKFVDALRLPYLNRLGGYQFGADANRGRSRLLV